MSTPMTSKSARDLKLGPFMPCYIDLIYPKVGIATLKLLVREIASKIKEHTLTHLDQYLEEFERNAIRRGAQVHWARDAAEHNEIVVSILRSHGIEELIKEQIDAPVRVRYAALPGASWNLGGGVRPG